MKSCFMAVLCLFSLTGCGAIPPSPEKFGTIEVLESADGSRVTFSTPSAFGGGWTMQSRYRLRGIKDRSTGVVSHELYIRIWYNEGGLRDFELASFTDGRQLHVTKIDAKPSYIGRRFGAFEEWVGVPLETAWITSLRTSGFEVTIKAKSGHEVSLKIPGAYLEKYLDAVGALDSH